jgi:hypothetical protein
MPKPEGRNPKEIRRAKSEKALRGRANHGIAMDLTAVIRASGFGLLSDFGPSGFGFRETGIVIQVRAFPSVW